MFCKLKNKKKSAKIINIRDCINKCKKMCPIAPKYDILHWCEYIGIKHIEITRQGSSKGYYYYDLPTIAVICYDKNYTISSKSYSHFPSSETIWNSVLKAKLEELAPIGTKESSKGTKPNIINPLPNKIGNCAEQHAGNKFMISQDEKNLSNLHFGPALVVRTKEFKAPCKNCKYVFPNLK